MTDNEEPKIRLPKTHPYLAKLVLDPGEWYEFEQRFQYRPEVKIRKLDDSVPDHWTVYVACASEEVKDLLDKHWGTASAGH